MQSKWRCTRHCFFDINIPVADLMSGSSKQHTKHSPDEITVFESSYITDIEFISLLLWNHRAKVCHLKRFQWMSMRKCYEVVAARTLQAAEDGCGTADRTCFPDVQNIITVHRITDTTVASPWAAAPTDTGTHSHASIYLTTVNNAVNASEQD